MFINRKAKETIQRLISKLQGGPLDNNKDGQTGVIELLVPGGKVGLIIGKGGETIKQLQASHTTKVCTWSLKFATLSTKLFIFT